jgi:multifunctional beta-oxidation protein
MADFNDKGAFTDPADPPFVAEAKRDIPDPVGYTYTERDVILYNLGIGATAKELQWTYENHEEFAALPTFGFRVQPGMGLSLDWLPNYNPVSLYAQRTCR